MTPTTNVRDQVRRALQSAVDADTANLVSSIKDLDEDGWHESGPLILEALFNSVDRLPSAGPHDAAEITQRAISRFDDSLNISADVMQAEIREAAGETGATRDIPRNLGVVHCLVAAGQIVHEGYLTLDEATVHDPPPPATSGP